MPLTGPVLLWGHLGLKEGLLLVPGRSKAQLCPLGSHGCETQDFRPELPRSPDLVKVFGWICRQDILMPSDSRGPEEFKVLSSALRACGGAKGHRVAADLRRPQRVLKAERKGGGPSFPASF